MLANQGIDEGEISETHKKLKLNSNKEKTLIKQGQKI